jgi:hypothetical protein
MTISLTAEQLMRKCWLFTFSALLMFFPLTSSMGQTVTGSLHIRVVESSGAVVPGASVTLTNQDNGRTLTATTSADGEVVFTNLEPGRYTARVSSTGFAVTAKENIQVTMDAVQTLELRLNLGGAEVVLVSAGERQEELSSLPNLNNDLTPLLQIVPGALATGSTALGKVVFDGKGKDQQTSRLDGLDSTPQVDLPANDPAIDLVSSFQKPEVAFDLNNSKTQSRAFPAISGPGTGSVVEGVTFHGFTNWRAQIYAEHRNDALNARNFFDFEGKNGLRRNRFGGKIGGPLGSQQKVFMYVGYEGVRARIERSIYEAVPIDSVCGCVSGSLGALLKGYVPAGTIVLPGTSLNTDFVVAKRRAQTHVDANSWNGRLDWSMSASKSLAFRYTRQASDGLVPDGVTGRQQDQGIVFNNASARFTSLTSKIIQNVAFGLNYTGGRATSEIFPSTAATLASALIAVGGTVKTFGLPGNPTTVPVATLGNFIKGLGRGSNLKPTSLNLLYGFDEPLSTNNEIFFGVEARFVNLELDRLGGLTYAFPNLPALRTLTPGSVTFLSDLSASSPFSTGVGPRHASQKHFLSYFQMVSNLRPRLTVTYGFRYDYFGAVHERDNRVVIVDRQTGVILSSGSPFYRAAKNNFQPRFGLEYRLAEGGFFGNTVLRLGGGFYSGVPKIGDLLLPIDSDRFSTGVSGGAFPMDPNDVTKGFIEHPETRQFQPLAFDRNFTTPERAYKWEGSLTQTVKGIYDLKFLYTGNVGRNLPLAGIANPIITVATNPDPTKPAVVVRQLDIVSGGQVFKPYGEFFYRSSDGRSSYNGLSIQFKRNTKTDTSLPNSLRLGELNAQYTFSRNVGNASGAVVSNPLNFQADYGYNAADVRHSFTLSVAQNLWDAFGLDPLKGRTDFLRGWKVAETLTARSGFPLVIRIDRPDVVYVDASGSVFSSPAVGRQAIINTPGGGATGSTRVPDLLAGVNPYLRNDLELLNPAAFAIPQPGKFGNLKRGQLHGPGSVQLDLSLTRYLFDKEHVVGDFRVDLFNVFNHANFNNPTASLPNALGLSAPDNQIQPGVPFTRLSAGSFGVFTAADTSRLIQFTFTLRFNEGFSK